MFSVGLLASLFCLVVIHARSTSAQCWSKNACIATSVCSAKGGTSKAGLCPGPTQIQCCSCSTCMDVKTCSAKGGKSQPGICPGPSNVQCCKLGSGKPKPVNTMLTNLAAILRRAGLRVLEQPGWKTRGHGKMASVKSILIHHTAGPSKGEYPSLGVVRDGRKDLPGPLAQLGLGRSGTWYVIAAGRCYHAGKTINDSIFGNSNSIGIEAEGTGTPSDNTGHRYWPPVQWNSYVRGVKALQAAYGVPTARVLGHKEAAVPKGRKVDPNFSMTEFRAALR
ncbi:unnamed protein product [Rotaria sordida]|uniref:N-acetylmuramoyl-L-alanine amidase domain-containing protein n=1 Tax=Rotaria sordida TaxID=392033 RepID=A0A815AQ56_9BILA|nr:unnamed protein product [Rotaria sordida]CAF1540417.1 unnamed protein product [Rotaria sordida]